MRFSDVRLIGDRCLHLTQQSVALPRQRRNAIDYETGEAELPVGGHRRVAVEIALDGRNRHHELGRNRCEIEPSRCHEAQKELRRV